MTLVSHDHKFILLRTRKTASTSTEMYLQPYCTPPGTPVVELGECIVSEHGIVGQRLGKTREVPAAEGVVRDQWFSHHAAQKLKSKLGASVWKEYTKITIVRNPFEKVRSAFMWQNRNKLETWTDKQKINRFRRQVKAERYKDDREIVFTKLKSKKPIFAPQVLIRSEHLQEDLLSLSETLKLDPSITTLPHTKSTVKKRPSIPLADWYDTETIDCVRQRLAWIFEHGDYPDTPA